MATIGLCSLRIVPVHGCMALRLLNGQFLERLALEMHAMVAGKSVGAKMLWSAVGTLGLPAGAAAVEPISTACACAAWPLLAFHRLQADAHGCKMMRMGMHAQTYLQASTISTRHIPTHARLTHGWRRTCAHTCTCLSACTRTHRRTRKGTHMQRAPGCPVFVAWKMHVHHHNTPARHPSSCPSHQLGPNCPRSS